MELVSQLSVRDKTGNSQTELQETTGANVSGSPSSKSPRTQYRALNLLISPSGVRLRRNTQVPGRILDLALEVSSSIHVPFFSRLVISFLAASIHFSMFAGVSIIAASYDNVSGSDGVALKANESGGGSPLSVKSQASDG